MANRRDKNKQIFLLHPIKQTDNRTPFDIFAKYQASWKYVKYIHKIYTM